MNTPPQEWLCLALVILAVIFAVRWDLRRIPKHVPTREERISTLRTAVRIEVEKKVVAALRAGKITAPLENQPIFEQDNYEQIVARVCEQTFPSWWPSLGTPLNNSLFYCDVLSKANDIVLARIKEESDRVWPIVRAALLEEMRRKAQ